METMILDRMYSLDSVLQTQKQDGSRYILLGSGERNCSISFGRSGKLCN